MTLYAPGDLAVVALLTFAAGAGCAELLRYAAGWRAPQRRCPLCARFLGRGGHRCRVRLQRLPPIAPVLLPPRPRR